MGLAILWFIIGIVAFVCGFLLGYNYGYDEARKGLYIIEMQIYELEELNRKLLDKIKN